MRFAFLEGTASDEEIANTELLVGCDADPITLVSDLKGHDLLVLFGGEDISPALYHELPRFTSAPKFPSGRDKVECSLFDGASMLDIPTLGICRGAQLVCVRTGGLLWQHVDGHEGQDHEIHINSPYGSGTLISNSAHHQLMMPEKDSAHEVVAYASCRSPTKGRGIGEVSDMADEAEIVITRFGSPALMVQGHPEWVGVTHPLFKFVSYMVKEYLL